MHSWKSLLVLASTVGAVLAAAVALVFTRIFTTQDIIDAAASAVVVAALLGLYTLRRRARDVLVYDRGVATSSSGLPGTGPDDPQMRPLSSES